MRLSAPDKDLPLLLNGYSGQGVNGFVAGLKYQTDTNTVLKQIPQPWLPRSFLPPLLRISPPPSLVPNSARRIRSLGLRAKKSVLVLSR
jgi:hypothetical protein